MGRAVALKWHDALIRALAERGQHAEQIAEALGASLPGVIAYCKRNGIAVLTRGVNRTKPASGPQPRDTKMAEMFRQGVTLEKIGQQFGVSRERVRQLIKKHHGLIGKDGGKAFHRNAESRESKQARQEQRLRLRILDKYGLTVEQWRHACASGLMRDYVQQRRNALVRGIEWHLSLAQWLRIWESSGRLELRGRGKGRYCMSRIKDSGGYVMGNVHIQLNDDNGREAVEKWRGKRKQFPGVYMLCAGTDRPFVARVNGVQVARCATAEQAAAERAAYIQANNIIIKAGVGRGRGWTVLKGNKSRPYQMYGPGGARSYHATKEEARAAYLKACEEYKATKVD